MRRTAELLCMPMVMFVTFGLWIVPVYSQVPDSSGAANPNESRATIDTTHRVVAAPYLPELEIEKGKLSGGVRVICLAESDTVTLGQPMIFEFGAVNVGREAAGVYAGTFSPVVGNMPLLFVADPSGFEYPYRSAWTETRWFPCEAAVGLSPGDTLTAVLQVTYYGSNELLFPSPGRWGLCCGYFMTEDECHRRVQALSDIAWVEVVGRDSVDSLAWEIFKRAKPSLVAYEPITDDSVMSAFRDVVRGYPESSYYAYSLYMYSRCLQVSRQYEEAIRSFNRYRAEYPRSLLAQESLFRIAQCLHELGRTAEAVRTFDPAHEADKSNWKGLPSYRPKYAERRPWGRFMY
jgi:hypothetical protein